MNTNATRFAPDTYSEQTQFIGPGLIVAAAVMGSGELIATTKVGAQAGFTLLWLIIVGCLIKVFVQVELGRYLLTTNQGTVDLLAKVPGPKLKGANWVMWIWLVMMVTVIAQLGGIVHGVGQALAIAFPLTGDYNRFLDACANGVIYAGSTWDDILWATIVTLITVVLLDRGRYQFIQKASIWMVALFTGATALCVVLLQFKPEWAMTFNDLTHGLSFKLPPVVEGLTKSPITTALATLGMIGMAATDLIYYPYFCRDRGYSRWTGLDLGESGWADRAKSWMKVIRLDAFCSAICYTMGTVLFYLLGASTLHRLGLDPTGDQMVSTLAEMYRPAFGLIGVWLLLFGAISVLYSTFFVAPAGHARVSADAIRIFGIGANTEQSRQWWVHVFSVSFPVVALVIMLIFRQPVALILTAGVLQAIMLPLVGFGALLARYRLSDNRIKPGPFWDFALIGSVLVLLFLGGWMVCNGLSQIV